MSWLLITDVTAQSRSRDTTFVITERTNLDDAFKQAREIGNEGDYEQARRICHKILERKPDYYDVRTYIGRTYAWEKQYDNARTELSRVLIEKENDIEALSALIDVETWSGNLGIANDYMKLALSLYPTSEELLLKKARLQVRQDDRESAAVTLRKVIDLNPGNKEALNMMITLDAARLNNRIQTSYTVDFFDRDFKPQQLLSAEAGRSFRFGSLIMRGNAADRFGYQGIQYEIESYLRFTKSSYANLLAGFSTSRIFPEQNYGAEIYQRLPAGFELSGGIRYLQYTNATIIYTGSLSNYYKNYWISVRAFVTPQEEDTTSEKSFIEKSSETFFFRMRRYLTDSDHFFGIRVGYGESPDDRRFYRPVVAKLTTWQLGAELQRRAFGRFFVKAEVNYAQEEIRADEVYQRLTMSVQLKTTF